MGKGQSMTKKVSELKLIPNQVKSPNMIQEATELSKMNLVKNSS
jgi:hypothetical protein